MLGGRRWFLEKSKIEGMGDYGLLAPETLHHQCEKSPWLPRESNRESHMPKYTSLPL